MRTKFLIAGLALALVGGGMLVVRPACACGKNSKSASTSSTACCSKANSATASVTSASAGEKSFSKEECVNWLMANESMSKQEAETVYSAWLKTKGSSEGCAMAAGAVSGCTGKANTTRASYTASGICPYAHMAVTDADAVAWLMVTNGISEEQAQARFAACSETRAAARAGAQTASAHCSQADCVNWLMANKGMTRAQAEAAFASCAKTKATAQVAVLAASAGKEATAKTTSSTSVSSSNY
jgi:hypothetical protein